MTEIAAAAQRLKTLKDGMAAYKQAHPDVELYRELGIHIAQLRHAYKQLAAGTVRDQRQFAEGLLAPAIRFLEYLDEA